MKQIVIVLGLLLVSGSSFAQTQDTIYEDSSMVADFHAFMEQLVEHRSDSNLVVQDTVLYRKRFTSFGGWSQYRNMKTSNMTSIQQPKGDSVAVVVMPRDETDSSKVGYFFIAGDSLYWGNPYYLEPRKDAISSESGIPVYDHKGLKFQINYPVLSNYWMGWRSDPIVMSFDQGRILVLQWPMILNYGSETNSGSQRTWYLERVD